MERAGFMRSRTIAVVGRTGLTSVSWCRKRVPTSRSMIICKVLSLAMLVSSAALGQSQAEVRVQETWHGLVVNSDIHGNYSLTVFGMSQLESPHMFRDSDYFAGVRISHSMSEASRLGVEYVQDRAYLHDSSLFLENRCSIDYLHRWKPPSWTTFYLQPKLELRRIAGTFDQRLKVHGEVLRRISAVRGTVRAFAEPAFDRDFHGFEKAVVHTGVLWPAGARLKLELFNSITIARPPDYNVEAVGVLIFVQLRNKGKGHDEITH
jgi:hypothetical protein